MNESGNNKTGKTAETSKPQKSKYTRDLIIVAILLAAALVLFFWMRSLQARDTGSGAQAVVTVEGREIGRYPLQKSGTFPLNGGTNILVVENGEAWVSEANCPDKVCMGMGKISRNGEFIACLPNRLLVVVEGAAESSPVDGMT